MSPFLRSDLPKTKQLELMIFNSKSAFIYYHYSICFIHFENSISHKMIDYNHNNLMLFRYQDRIKIDRNFKYCILNLNCFKYWVIFTCRQSIILLSYRFDQFLINDGIGSGGGTSDEVVLYNCISVSFHIYIYIHIHIYIYIYLCMYIYIYIYVYVCIYRIYIHTHIHVYIA